MVNFLGDGKWIIEGKGKMIFLMETPMRPLKIIKETVKEHKSTKRR